MAICGVLTGLAGAYLATGLSAGFVKEMTAGRGYIALAILILGRRHPFGVLVAALWWARKHRVHFFDVVDFVAPLVPLGLGFGRLGNWINGELWGKPTDGSWGVVFPKSLPPPGSTRTR